MRTKREGVRFSPRPVFYGHYKTSICRAVRSHARCEMRGRMRMRTGVRNNNVCVREREQHDEVCSSPLLSRNPAFPRLVGDWRGEGQLTGKEDGDGRG